MARQILHSFSWSKMFMADNSMVWLSYKRWIFTKNLHILCNNVFWVFFSFLFWWRTSYFKRIYIFLLRKLSCFLPLSLIRRLTNRLTETAVAYLSLSNSKEQTLNEQSLKWSHRGFFRNNSVVSWLNCTFYTAKSLNFCNCSVKYSLYFKASSWRILKKYIEYMYKLSLFLMLLRLNTQTVKNYLIYLLIGELKKISRMTYFFKKHAIINAIEME